MTNRNSEHSLPNLFVISDSPCFFINGKLYGFPSVVNELEAIRHNFSHVTWLAYQVDPKDYRGICIPFSGKVNAKLFRIVSGKQWYSKLNYIIKLPSLLFSILSNVVKHDVIHTRGPALPVLLSLLIAPFFPKKIWWNKYGGNWIERKAPKTYLFQRSLLKKLSKTTVTINGAFEKNSKHIINFENPSFWKHEIPNINPKVEDNFDEIQFVFLGRLTKEKGFDLFMDALSKIDIVKPFKVNIIGEGYLRGHYQKKLKHSRKFVFHGFQDKKYIFNILHHSHFLVLPSQSEGFPKVVSEGLAHGVVPIVSNLSAIPEYIQHGINGFLWDGDTEMLMLHLAEALQMSLEGYLKMSNNAFESAHYFSFERFVKRVEEEILTV